jgi:hypothetical protein
MRGAEGVCPFPEPVVMLVELVDPDQRDHTDQYIGRNPYARGVAAALIRAPAEVSS